MTGNPMGDLVLAIDDEVDFLDIVKKVAKSANYAATVTSDPAVFRAAIRTQSPTVVLLDLQMPNCDGIELLHALAEAQCRAKVILTSGFDVRVLSLARGIGKDLGLDMGDSLEKPLRPAVMREALAGLRGTVFQPSAAALREAIDNDRLELFYQPLVRLATGRTVGFEGLVRWRHPDFGIIMPDQFIALAERENLIDALTDRVLDLAVAQIAAWSAVGIEAPVWVNISATNIVAELPERLVHLCARHGVPPRLLCLELTETAAMGNNKLLLEVLTRVRLKGFQLAIDDFGTGYSSLVQLHRLPFSELKIDQSFVLDMASSEDAILIVGAIIGLGHSLRLELIAEGIETEEVAHRLVSMGCKTGQGYYFSRPMPKDQVTDWMAQHPPDQIH